MTKPLKNKRVTVRLFFIFTKKKYMSTIYTISLLIIFWIVLTPILMFVFPFSGIIGEMIGGEPSKRSKLRLFLGIIVATISQTYFYLAYIVFIISWTKYRIIAENFSNYIIWIIAFLSTMLPIWIGATNFKIHHKNKKTGITNIIVEASYICGILSFISFFIFIYNPAIMKCFWSWVPFVRL